MYNMYGNFGKKGNTLGGSGSLKSNSSIGGGSSSQYNSINEVVQAYNDGKINYNQACRILENDFGQGGKDCRDILIIDNPGAKPDCGVGKIAQFNTGTDRWECIPDPAAGGSSENNEEKPSWWDSLTADQKYFYIGLLVIAVLYYLVYSKRSE